MRSIPRDSILKAARVSVFLAVAIAAAPVYAWPRPAVLEESARLFSPDPQYLLSDVRVDGNDLLAIGTCYSCEPSILLFHYERQSDGTWGSRGAIASSNYEEYYTIGLEFKGGIAVLRTSRSFPLVLERTSSGWISSSANSGVSDIGIVGRTIALGAESGDGRAIVNLLEKNTAGQWAVTTRLVGSIGYPDNDFIGPEIEFAPNEVIAGNVYEYDDPVGGFIRSGYATYVFEKIGGAWQHVDVLDDLYRSVVIDDRIALAMKQWRRPGEVLSLYQRGASGTWSSQHSLYTDEWFADKRPGNLAVIGAGAQALLIAEAALDDTRARDAGSVLVFNRPEYVQHSYGPWVHAATLFASDANEEARLGASLSASGRTVAALGLSSKTEPQFGTRLPAIYVFELPDPLPAVAREQQTFEDSNSSQWLPWGTTNWRVVASNGSNVFRQTNTQGDARAIYQGLEGTNQSIEADLKANSLAIPTRSWAGLMLRYKDPQNFYYLLNSGTDALQIKRMSNGVYGPIASVPFTFQVGRSYRVRFEAVGTRLRAFVDGQLVMEVSDKTHSSGRAGLTMWKANVEYDNVIVSSSPKTTLHADSFSGTEDEVDSPPWTTSPAHAWIPATTSSGATVFKQTYLEHDARAVHGAPTEDQVVSADVRIRNFHTSGGWAGVMARYNSDGDYYYAYLRSNGIVSLRRLQEGRLFVIDEAPFNVVPGASYRMRLEAIGNSLRLYVNDRLVLEGEDASFPSGRYGLVTYRAGAEYDNFSTTRP